MAVTVTVSVSLEMKENDQHKLRAEGEDTRTLSAVTTLFTVQSLRHLTRLFTEQQTLYRIHTFTWWAYSNTSMVHIGTKGYEVAGEAAEEARKIGPRSRVLWSRDWRKGAKRLGGWWAMVRQRGNRNPTTVIMVYCLVGCVSFVPIVYCIVIFTN